MYGSVWLTTQCRFHTDARTRENLRTVQVPTYRPGADDIMSEKDTPKK
jgi:hypothetical protein